MAEEKRIAVSGAVWRVDDATLVEWDEEETRVTRPWPQPRAWRRGRTPNGAWREVFGRVHRAGWRTPPVRPRPLRPAEAARRAAWDTVPLDIREAIEAAALGSEEWPLLSMLARCPGALELTRSVPLLAGALASCRNFRREVKRPLRSIRALLRPADGMGRWRRIATWLGFDGSRAFVNVLRRIPPGARFWPQDLRALQRVWSHPFGRKRLLHAPRLGRELVRLLEVLRDRGGLEEVHPDLLDALAAAGPWGSLGNRLDAVLLGWRERRPGRPLPAWRTVEQVEAAFVELVAEARQEEAEALAELGFPQPPLPAGPGISPIASAEELVAEGGQMQHCIGAPNWAREAGLRLGYGYRVQVGEDRATLWLQRDSTSPFGFALTQLRGPSNAAPTPAVVDAVARWLQALGVTRPALSEEWSAVQPPPSTLRYPWAREDEIPF